jgi:hypothetical protein
LTANLAQIKEAQALGVLDGVTTTIIDGKEELPEKQHFETLC